jgi:hypothetical protein
MNQVALLVSALAALQYLYGTLLCCRRTATTSRRARTTTTPPGQRTRRMWSPWVGEEEEEGEDSSTGPTPSQTIPATWSVSLKIIKIWYRYWCRCSFSKWTRVRVFQSHYETQGRAGIGVYSAALSTGLTTI